MGKSPGYRQFSERLALLLRYRSQLLDSFKFALMPIAVLIDRSKLIKRCRPLTS
jgi:hypothetical protein